MLRALIATLALALAFPASAQSLIAHRGASGERPEHTLAAFELAIRQGADFIELDLVPTKDGELIVRHENELSLSTDVADRAEFAGRKTTKLIDGRSFTGWFAEDFTLAEIRTLRARERIPAIRPRNRGFDGLYAVPTLQEVIALVRALEGLPGGRRVGFYLELKHPAWFLAQGHDTTAMLARALAAAGLEGAGQPVVVQTFEVEPLERLARSRRFTRVQLIAAQGGPADRPGQTYAAMLTAEGLREVARRADGVALDLALFDGDPERARALVKLAREAGLAVHVWTLRRENRFLWPAFRNGADPDAPGDMAAAWRLLAELGISGIITDNPGDVSRR
ncbi:MAG TPA: glycerophosphodiester phosphodiesterase family protein [Novosphingobium sp.]|nr:glycerophosphodiester phosphodiesterase family protein [Novosphingobium sp.]HMP56696.1 glycerophosphodiester phosphodiesterase family protein [Novosphingobium sp.]